MFLWFGSLETTPTQAEEGGQNVEFQCGTHWPSWAGSQWACTAHTQLSKKIISVSSSSKKCWWPQLYQTIEKNKLHSWSVQRPEQGHWMFPNSRIKEIYLNALKHLFSWNPICQTISGSTLITESACLPTTSISQSTEFKLQQKTWKPANINFQLEVFVQFYSWKTA